MDLKYGNKIIEMQGIIVEVNDGLVAVDFKGRLGYLKIPMRMLITNYPLKVGLEVGLKMSFVEILSGKVNEKYMSNIDVKNRREGK